MESWKAFSVSCWLWKHFPCKKLSRWWRSGSRLARGQVNMADEAKLHSPIFSTLKCWLCNMGLGIVMEKNWVLFVDQCQLQVCIFLVHLIDLLSICLRCNGFPGIQKAVVNQTGGRPPNRDYDLFRCKFGFGKSFGASSWFNYWVGHCLLSYTIHFLLHITIQLRNGSLLLHRTWEDNTSKRWFFWFVVSSTKHPLIELFYLSICFQCAMTTEWSTQFFGNFSCSCKRISFDDCSQFGHCQLPMASHCAPYLQGSSLLCETPWTSTALYVY